MLYVKEGKIHSKYCSFALPEDWFFFYSSGVEVEDGFELSKYEDSESVRMNIGVQYFRPLSSLEALNDSKEFVSMSEIFPVSRGGLKGKALFYHSLSWDREYYEEHLELGSDKVLEFFLACDVTAKTKGKIKDILNDPSVVGCLSSIQAK